jgi:hypothetical protein
MMENHWVSEVRTNAWGLIQGPGVEPLQLTEYHTGRLVR